MLSLFNVETEYLFEDEQMHFHPQRYPITNDMTFRRQQSGVRVTTPTNQGVICCKVAWGAVVQ